MLPVAESKLKTVLDTRIDVTFMLGPDGVTPRTTSEACPKFVTSDIYYY
jgi:hypothetical protein